MFNATKQALLRQYLYFGRYVFAVLKKKITLSHELLSKVSYVQHKHKKYQLQTFRKVAERRKDSQNSAKALFKDLIEFSPSKGLCV